MIQWWDCVRIRYFDGYVRQSCGYSSESVIYTKVRGHRRKIKDVSTSTCLSVSCFVPFSNFDEEESFKLTVCSYQLQVYYYNDLTSVGDYAANVSQRRAAHKELKTFMDKNMLEEIMLHHELNLHYVSIQRYNINTLCVTSNLCECYFARLKFQCQNDQSVIRALSAAKKLQLRDEVKQLLDNYLTYKFTRFRQQEYCRQFCGNHNFSSNYMSQQQFFCRVIYKVATNQSIRAELNFIHYQNKEDLIISLIQNTKLASFQFLANYRQQSMCDIKSDISSKKQSRQAKIFVEAKRKNEIKVKNSGRK
ncbi:Hypothetical_protein [Hexamita inflata]|uniref:Hypothetical_protein n=1 Tax=Hexamita inflata TaxID=28002 RepID=A0AA86UBL1_9EUKA|nr:Hypothetical protein HINF_LOCUS33646 [Hexamita inflata]